MKECMRELKAYKAAMQSLPSGCLAAEAEAEKQEKLSVEITGSQTGPMSCSEQTELFVRASGQKTGMVYTQKLDANASDVIAQALTNSEASAAKRQSRWRQQITGKWMWQRIQIMNRQKHLSLSKQQRIRQKHLPDS